MYGLAPGMLSFACKKRGTSIDPSAPPKPNLLLPNLSTALPAPP